jgi:hypothetical protein
MVALSCSATSWQVETSGQFGAGPGAAMPWGACGGPAPWGPWDDAAGSFLWRSVIKFQAWGNGATPFDY